MMTRTKLPLLLALALAGATLGSLDLTARLLAQPSQPVNNTPRQTRFRFIPPKRIGKPITVGAATRGGCLDKGKLLTALIPKQDNVGLTVSDRPTFWVYVPYEPKEVLFGEFSLQDEADNEVYRTRFELSGAPGVVSVSVPSTKAALETGKVYNWYFKISCPSQEAADEPDTAFVRGWVERVSRPDLESQLKATTTPVERIAIYAKEGIWYEALTSLAQSRLTNSQDRELATAWADILQSAGLEKLDKERVVGSVKTNSPP
jgi:hypothetical protein